MINRKFFFSQSRISLFDGIVPVSAAEGIEVILSQWETNYDTHDDRWLAYILGTVHYESDRSFKPMSEGGARLRHLVRNEDAEGRANGEVAGRPDDEELERYFGRGFVLLTWKANYAWVGDRIGVDLVNEPHRAADLDVASQVIIAGMRHGWFNGRMLADYFNSQVEDSVGAREVLNGRNKANLVAGYAMQYYAAISYTL